MIEIDQPTERAFLLGAPRRGSPDARLAEDHLDELERLADTAGAKVTGRTIQQVDQPTPRFYLGAGKVEEVADLVREHEASLVVFDEELSPAQGKNLEQAFEVRVMDRAELILDIFASRARSKEAKLQVELAQLEYLLPRLARMWVHLSRIRGGIGLRGPGETQLETDRRMIRRKIGKLKGQLRDVERHRQVIRSGRRPVPTAALVGYTNAGKSSLLRALTGSETFIEDRLFATLDTLTRETELPGRLRLRLVDTVGFIRKLPHHLVASFRATLEEARYADLLLHVVDASHPSWEEQVDVVDRVLADLEIPHVPLLHVLNKIDLVEDPEALCARARRQFPPAVCASALEKELADLRRAIAEAVSAGVAKERGPKRAEPPLKGWMGG
jgi:GTP-binding protein HflX